MNKRNTMKKGEFIFYNIFYALVFAIWYESFLYRCLPGCTLTVSKIIFWGGLLLLTALGVVLSFRLHRNSFSIFMNVLTPLEVYTITSFWKDLTTLALISVSLSLLLAAGYIVLVLIRKTKPPTRNKQIVCRRIKVGAYCARTITAFCMLIFFVPICINALFGQTLVFKNTAAEVPSSAYACTIANNIEVVATLREDIWATLDNNEKASTLQTIANIEAFHLGLPHELNLKVKTLDESTIAEYDDRNHTITINVVYLESMSATEMLDGVCHEAFHAYQHRLCDAYKSVADEYKGLLTFHNVPEYTENFNQYESGDSNLSGYYLQGCEITARQYAEDRVDFYYNEIETYMYSHENGNKCPIA